MSKVPYDKYYQDLDYFGQPYPGMVDFFDKFDQSLHILDMGCGQGRDAIMLGRLGYKVTGIDISSVGIEQMNQIAHKEGIDVRGFTRDLKAFKMTPEFDMVLTDSMLHFYQKDKEDEMAFVSMLLSQLEVGQYWCNCIISGKGREALIKKLILDHKYHFEWVEECLTPYASFEVDYYMTVIKRVEQ